MAGEKYDCRMESFRQRTTYAASAAVSRASTMPPPLAPSALPGGRITSGSI
jgi:hypothetical protein